MPRNCIGDDGRPIEVGLQEQASNHLKLHWSRAIVVSVEEKIQQRLYQMGTKETNENEPSKRCRNKYIRHQNQGV